MALDWTTAIWGFLVAIAIAAAGAYFATKYTDRRREKEATGQAREEFLRLKAQMPDLIAAIKTDLASKDGQFVREFFVLESCGVRLGGSEKPRFVYYGEEHGDLHGKITVLENQGLVYEVTQGNAPVFRMTEEFVDVIQRYG